MKRAIFSVLTISFLAGFGWVSPFFIAIAVIATVIYCMWVDINRMTLSDEVSSLRERVEELENKG